jgi:[NiFe] hydrogenase diaphorase moiety large subunit
MENVIFNPNQKKRTGPVIFSEYKRGDAIKKIMTLSREDILFELKDSKLKGRGGAGFPTSTKWMLTAAAKADQKFIVCNADEGEPGTFKDRVLLSEYPELVFDGMVIGGYTIGAQWGILYLRGEYEYLLKPLDDYLEEMRKDNLLGKNILGKEGFDFDIFIVLGSGAYVCGEETALIESLEGHRGEPRNRPPYPINTGYLGRPTCVNNVETLSAITHIIMKGGSWFSKFGTDKSSGSKLFSVCGDCAKPGVYELPWGTKVSELLKIVEAKTPKLFRLVVLQGIAFQNHNSIEQLLMKISQLVVQ